MNAVNPAAGHQGPRLLAVAAVLLGVSVRIFFLLTPEGQLDGDEAVTGIMAQRMAHRHQFAIFFAGQTYNGTIEQFPQALLFSLGVPENAFTLRLPELALAALSCWLVFVVGSRILASAWHAALASLLFALGPYFLIWDGARSIGGYVTQIVVGLLGVLLAMEATQEADAGRQRWLVLGFGVCFGITYWLTLSGYYLLIPAALWLGPCLLRRRRLIGAAALGVLVGLFPILYWTVDNGRWPLPNPNRPHTTALERFGNLTDEVGREFVGVAHLYGAPGWPVVLGRLLVAALLVLWAVTVVRRRKSIWRLVRLRPDGRRPLDIFLLAVAILIVAYVASSYAWFVKEPRYLFSAYPVLILGLAAIPPRRGRAAVLAAAALVLLVGAPSITMLITRADDAPANRDRDLRRAVSALRAEGTTSVYADYWTAMPLQFVARDALAVGSITTIRFPGDRRKVDAEPDPPWVASRSINADDITPMRQALQDAGIEFRERRFGVVSVFDDFSRRVRPWQVPLRSTA